MRKKSIVITLLAVSIFSLILYGCLYDPADDINIHPAYRDSNGDFTGTASGSAPGYKSDITVGITLEKGFIKTVNITHSDDPEYADKAVETAKRLIVETNSFAIDAISGATYTRDGIKVAGEQALKSKGLIDGKPLGAVSPFLGSVTQGRILPSK
jgi:fumarate reductase flavoprotein subunit